VYSFLLQQYMNKNFHEIYAFLVYYVAWKFLLMFRGNLSVHSSCISWPSKMVPIGCLET